MLIHVCFKRQQLKQPVCPKCRTNIIGRATDMENFLKVNFFKIESSRARKYQGLCQLLNAQVLFPACTGTSKLG